MDLQNILRIVGKVAGIVHWLTRLLRGEPAPPPDISTLGKNTNTKNQTQDDE